MTQHKFTDEEVIKALELHSDALKPCLYKCVYGEERYCGSKMAKDALALINRQKAEIEKLQTELKAMRGAANSYKMHYENAKVEVIKQYLAMVTAKVCAAWNFSRSTPVVTLDVLEYYARVFTEGNNDGTIC